MVARGARPLATTSARAPLCRVVRSGVALFGVVRSRVALAVVVVSVVLASTLVVAPARRAEAAEGFRLTAETVFRLDATVPTVDVESTYAMTNTSPDRDLGDGRIRYYFFTEVILPLTPGATGVTVAVDGRAADFDVLDDEGYPYVEVSLGYELRYRRTATIVVRYQLPGDPPRTPDSFTRVNPAYVSFPVTVFADEGSGSVRIEVPEAWVTEHVGADLTARVEGGLRVLEATAIAQPLDFWVAFTARDDSRLTSASVTTGGAVFEVRAWPGDTDWAAFATRLVSSGPPALARIVGEPWPEERATVVIEASTPYLRGYGGYYYASDNSIEVGEDLDGQTMLHELAHAWFNSSRIRQRWLSEGLSEAVSVAAARELGEEVVELDDELDGSNGGEIEPFPLNEWRSPSGDDDPAEEFGYATSYLVVSSLFDEIGPEARTELLSAVVRGVRAYQGEGDEVTVPGAVDWRRFLDLAEQIGGATTIEALYRDHVASAAQLDTLDERRDSVDALRELAERGGTWAPPESIRSTMSRWLFASALERIDAAHAALDVRDELATSLAPLGLAPTSAIEEAYQDATGPLDDVVARLTAQRSAADELVDARSALAAVLDGLELDAPELTQDDYEQDPLGVVGGTRELLDAADELAATRAELDTVLDRIGVSVPPLEPAAFVDDRVAAQQRLDDLLAAARAVAAAHARRDAADSFLERIGAIGSDTDEWLASADDRLSDGAPGAAIDAAAAATAAIDDLDDAGRARVLVAGVGVAALMLVAGAVAVRARRRRQPPRTSGEGTQRGVPPGGPTADEPAADRAVPDGAVVTEDPIDPGDAPGGGPTSSVPTS